MIVKLDDGEVLDLADDVVRWVVTAWDNDLGGSCTPWCFDDTQAWARHDIQRHGLAEYVPGDRGPDTWLSTPRTQEVREKVCSEVQRRIDALGLTTLRRTGLTIEIDVCDLPAVDDPPSAASRVRILARPEVLSALAPEHRPPRYAGNECSDDEPIARRSLDPKEYGCLRCSILLAAEEAQFGSPELWIDTCID